MRKAQFVLGTIVFAGLLGSEPARWCIQNSEAGYPGDCAYQTREQCLASLSGRKGDYGENPSTLFGRPPQRSAPRGRNVHRTSRA